MKKSIKKFVGGGPVGFVCLIMAPAAMAGQASAHNPIKPDSNPKKVKYFMSPFNRAVDGF